MVKAVFAVQQITEHRNYYKCDSSFKGNQKTIQMSPIAPRERVPEELRTMAKQFWDASPSGELKLATMNPEAAAYFEIDGIYELTFRKIGQLE